MSRPLVLTTAALVLVVGCEEPAPPDLSGIETRLDRIDARLDRIEAALVEAPPAVAARPSKPSRIAIEITPEETRVNGEVVAAVALRAHLQVLATKHPGASVTIQSGRTVEYDRVTRTLEAVRGVGLDRVAFVSRE